MAHELAKVKHNADEPNKAFPNTSTKLIEFNFDWTDGGKRYGGYKSHNEKIEKAGGDVPMGLREIGFDKYPSTFYWFETKWNPYTNPNIRNMQRTIRSSLFADVYTML